MLEQIIPLSAIIGSANAWAASGALATCPYSAGSAAAAYWRAAYGATCAALVLSKCQLTTSEATPRGVLAHPGEDAHA